MPADLPSPPSRQQGTRPGFGMRFSLKSLMATTTGVALVLGLLVTIPSWLSQMLLGMIWIAASGLLLTGLVFARGDQRAFCIGAAVVATSMWTGIGGRFAGGIQSMLQGVSLSWGEGPFGGGQGLQLWLVHIFLAVAAVANGWLCVKARRFFEQGEEK